MLKKWKEKASEDLICAWIRGVIAGLDAVDEETSRKLLNKCGEACAKIWIDSYGLDLASCDLDSWIKIVNDLEPGVRDVKREQDSVLYKLKSDKCLCPLVSENLIELTPKLCSACASSFYHYFSEPAKRPVRVEFVESLATGADKCIFRIWLL